MRLANEYTLVPNRTATKLRYPIGSYCVGRRPALDTVPINLVYPISSYCHDLRDKTPIPSKHDHIPSKWVPLIPLEKIYAGHTSTAPNFLTTLPMEIVYKILSVMNPEDYANLAATCRIALRLCNNQVALEQPGLLKAMPELTNFASFSEDWEQYETQYLNNAQFVGLPKIDFAAWRGIWRRYMEEMDTPCMGGYIGDDDDSDF